MNFCDALQPLFKYDSLKYKFSPKIDNTHKRLKKIKIKAPKIRLVKINQ